MIDIRPFGLLVLSLCLMTACSPQKDIVDRDAVFARYN
jgi:hypothetical protein